MGRRIYIYRSGDTHNCALTGIKDDPRLLPAIVPDRWRLWMQIGPHQAQGNRYGFGVRDAVRGIITEGYFLFTGSRVLLNDPLVARSTPTVQRETADV